MQKFDLELSRKANPLLFSPERYEEYPLKYDELKQYILSQNPSHPHHNNRPYTSIDYFDYLLYRSENDSSEIDLDKKLVSEFALYYVQKKHLNSDDLRPTLNEILKLKPDSTEWYEMMLKILVSVNTTGINQLTKENNSSFPNSKRTKSSTTMGSADRFNSGTDNIGCTNDETGELLQELTSFLMSNSIQKGVNIKPIPSDDPVKFLKNGINSILDTCLNLEKTTSVLPTSLDASVVQEKDCSKKLEELETAFNDLQLAHNFLTKQFENDRAEYVQDIEKLTRTNRELQDRLLNYHSSLNKTEKKLYDLEQANKDLEKANSKFNLSKHNFSVSSPVSSPSNWDPASPSSMGSPTSGSGSRSLSIMTGEFKKVLTSTQRKYENELSDEREHRYRLERELALLKSKKVGTPFTLDNNDQLDML
ncbi:pea2p [Saccharomyces arboricola H-6]|uniref:Pea2p n=1 Tax=Saccharomyces arboricola (strain H-6 / AS 2.3317 / CBS 10644) TaxID=1160507 RepID=J8Q5P8_SACAR|nr:pea2p [Saccharomyces arboricola H-6]